MNSRRLVQAAIGAALVGLTALTSNAALADAPGSMGRVMDRDTYIVTVRGLLAGQPGSAQSDADLIASGKSICTEIDNGATAASFEQQIKDYGLDRAVYRVLIRASVMTFCPQHSGQIIR